YDYAACARPDARAHCALLRQQYGNCHRRAPPQPCLPSLLDRLAPFLQPLLINIRKGGAAARPPPRSYNESSDAANVRRLQALLALRHFELHLVAFREATEAVGLDGGVVNENVRT